MSTTARRGVFVAAGLLLAVLLAVNINQAQQSSAEMSLEWAKVRRPLEKYQDVIVALRDGYKSGVLYVR
jgi:hypothetical protein